MLNTIVSTVTRWFKKVCSWHNSNHNDRMAQAIVGVVSAVVAAGKAVFEATSSIIQSGKDKIRTREVRLFNFINFWLTSTPFKKFQDIKRQAETNQLAAAEISRKVDELEKKQTKLVQQLKAKQARARKGSKQWLRLHKERMAVQVRRIHLLICRTFTFLSG